MASHDAHAHALFWLDEAKLEHRHYSIQAGELMSRARYALGATIAGAVLSMAFMPVALFSSGRSTAAGAAACTAWLAACAAMLALLYWRSRSRLCQTPHREAATTVGELTYARWRAEFSCYQQCIDALKLATTPLKFWLLCGECLAIAAPAVFVLAATLSCFAAA